MSTPDLRGTQGTFSWFSTVATESPIEGGLKLPLTRHSAGFAGSLPGPETSSLPFQLELINPTLGRLRISHQTIDLPLGQYSPWIRLGFPTRGIARFLLTQTDPDLSLYVTPVEIDPENPALPISHPGHYAIYLSKLLGSFATLGLAEDTSALNEGAIDEDAFLQQAKLIQSERESMFFNALDRTRRGLTACVFDTTDRVQHMFYRHLEENSRHANVIEDLYCDMDRIVGRTLSYADARTAVVVLSDHGFCSFRRGVNLNAWLFQNGYLHLHEGRTESGDYLEGIDWSRTRAYTFGLSGIYLNLQGREAQGIVPFENAAALRAKLSAQLTGLQDSRDNQIAIQAVYDSAAIYRGPYLDAAPDLVIGYAPGYRAAWSRCRWQSHAIGLRRQQQMLERRSLCRSLRCPGRALLQSKVEHPQSRHRRYGAYDSPPLRSRSSVLDGRPRTRMKAKTIVKLNASLCERARQVVERVGYSCLEEFIEHAMERDLARLETSESKDDLIRKLKGLGYLK